MAGNVELREHADATIVRVCQKFADFVLRVEESLGAHFVQLRKLLALDAEALIVGQVPVHDVHLHRRHSIQVALEHVQRNEVTADVDEQAAPGESRLILDRDRRYGKSLPGGFHQLQECLKAVQNAQRIWRRKLRA